MATKTTADKDAKASDDAATEKPKKGKKKKLLLAVPLLAVAVGVFLFLKPSAPEAAEKPKEGVVVKLDPVHVNLADGHFLKLGLALQATDKAGKELDGSKALDLAIALLSNREKAELASNEGREAAKKQLVKAVEKAYEGEVMDIYLTEFVMQ